MKLSLGDRPGDLDSTERVGVDSNATNLSPDDADFSRDVFVRELGPSDSSSPGGTQPPGASPPGGGTPSPLAPPLPRSPAPSRATTTPSAKLSLRVAITEVSQALRRLGIRGLLRKGRLTVAFAAPGAGTLQATATANISGSKAALAKSIVVLIGQRTFREAGKGRIKLRLTAKGRRALAPVRRARLVLRLVYIDAMHQTSRQFKTVKLTR